MTRDDGRIQEDLSTVPSVHPRRTTPFDKARATRTGPAALPSSSGRPQVLCLLSVRPHTPGQHLDSRREEIVRNLVADRQNAERESKHEA